MSRDTSSIVSVRDGEREQDEHAQLMYTCCMYRYIHVHVHVRTCSEKRRELESMGLKGERKSERLREGEEES